MKILKIIFGFISMILLFMLGLYLSNKVATLKEYYEQSNNLNGILYRVSDCTVSGRIVPKVKVENLSFSDYCIDSNSKVDTNITNNSNYVVGRIHYIFDINDKDISLDIHEILNSKETTSTKYKFKLPKSKLLKDIKLKYVSYTYLFDNHTYFVEYNAESNNYKVEEVS